MKSLYKTWLLALLALTLPQIAVAYQIPTTPNGSWTGTGTTVPATPATKDTPSGLRTTVSLTGAAMTFSARNDVTLMRSNNTTVPLLPTNTNGVQVLATVGGGACTDNTSLTCTGLGTMTVTFTDTAGNPISVRNPKLHLSRLGGFVTSGGNTIVFTDIFTLTTAGVTLGAPSTGAVNLTVTGGNQIQANLSTMTNTNAGVCSNAGCGTIPVTGTTSQLAFNVSAIRNNTSVNWNANATAGDAVFITASFDEDYGDAPASYDANSAASHIISDLALGTNITAENPNTANGGADGSTTVASSPNAVVAGTSNNGTNGDGTSDDGVSSFPALTTASSGSNYTVPVTLSGASRAGQSCGWIDFNKNGTFDSATERACASFVSGATSTNLTWTVPAGITVGNTYVRLRTSYDTTNVQNPTGRLSSGEVEDYQLAIAPAPGNISGSLYQDANNDNAFTTGETKLPANVDVELLNNAGTVIATVQTNATGDYTFTNVPVATGYQVRVVTSDPQIPSGYTIGTTNPITGIAVTTGATVANQNFGFRAAVVLPPSICSAAGGILGTNLLINNGSFGRLSGTPAQSTFGGALPAGRTTYIYDINSTTNFARGIDDGEYTIINKPTQTNFRTDGAWHLPYDHTEGSPSTNGLMMLINASFAPGVFYQEQLTVTPNTNYEFSTWIMNILKLQNAGIDPDVAFELDRIGMDDDNNAATLDGNEGQIIFSSQDITESASPTWLNFGAIVNSGTSTQIIVRFRNNNPGGGGNDLAIDDLAFTPCTPLPNGNISGTLYGDTNTNGNFDGGEPRVQAGVQVQLVNSSGAIISTAQTDNQGNYQFQNIPLGNYIIRVATTDPDLQGATPSSPSNAQLSVSLTTQGQNLSNRNFGFTGVTANKPNLLLVKRITAINGVDVTGFQDGVNTVGAPNNVGTKAADDNDAFWPSPNTTSLRGAIHSSTLAPTVNFKPGDEVEYTIYFLNKGAASANNVSICDFVPANQTYIGTGYNSSSFATDAGGVAGTNYGIVIQSANGVAPVKVTNSFDGDRGQLYTSGFPGACKGTNNSRGAVVVNMGTVPNATGSGTPANSYGFIRFKAKID